MRWRWHCWLGALGHGQPGPAPPSPGHRNNPPRDGQRPGQVTQLGRKVQGQASKEGAVRHQQGGRRGPGQVGAQGLQGQLPTRGHFHQQLNQQRRQSLSGRIYQVSSRGQVAAECAEQLLLDRDRRAHLAQLSPRAQLQPGPVHVAHAQPPLLRAGGRKGPLQAVVAGPHVTRQDRMRRRRLDRQARRIRRTLRKGSFTLRDETI